MGKEKHGDAVEFEGEVVPGVPVEKVPDVRERAARLAQRR